MREAIMSASTAYALVLGIAAVIFLWIGRQARIHSEEVRKRTPAQD